MEKEPMIVQGRIVKGIAGFYYVRTQEQGVVECHAKGIFRKEKVKPLVGDLVEIEILDEEEKTGSIRKVMPRTSYLIRPEVANVDQAVIVFSYVTPEPNLNLLDKFLIMMRQNNISCVICFNKEDIAVSDKKESLEQIYKDSGAKILRISAGEGTGIEELQAQLSGHISVLAGPSGVGKSTLINRICPEASMETGDISKKLERGKHTTRHSELFALDENTFLMDTPGFMAFELSEDMTKEELKDFYPEFYPYEGKCRYDGCSHTHEPQCSVKNAVSEGIIHIARYQGYELLYNELKNRRKY